MTLRLHGLTLTTATEFFIPSSRGEDAPLPFTTIQEAIQFSQVSPACAAIAERFLAQRAVELRSEIASIHPPMNPIDPALKDHFQEAEAVVTRNFPGLTADKRDAAIAKLFYSKLSYSMGLAAPLAASNETERSTETIAEFIRSSQDSETLEKFVPFMDAKITDSEMKMLPVKRNALTLNIREFRQNANTLQASFPGISAIIDQFLTGVFQRPTEAVVRAQVEGLLTRIGIPQLAIDLIVQRLSNAPEALTQGLNAGNIMMFVERLFIILSLQQEMNNFATLSNRWNEIKDLPSNTPLEIREKVSQIREAVLLFFDCTVFFDGSFIDFRRGGFTQILPEMEKTIRCATANIGHLPVLLNDNRFTRVPLLPESVSDLSIAGNPLKCFENLRSLRQLNTINFANTGLKVVPTELETIAPRLESIDLQNNNLIELPESFLGVEGQILIRGNPIMYIPPQLPFYQHLQLNMDGSIEDITSDMTAQPQSSLAKLYQYFIRPANTYNRQEAELLLANLSEENRNLVFERVWVESGSPQTTDAQWGQNHAFADLSILARAVRSSILTKLERLPEDERNIVYGRIYQLARSLEDVSPSWGKINATKCMVRLADALSLEVHPTAPIAAMEILNFTSLHALSSFHFQIQEFNRTFPGGATDLETELVLRKAEAKLRLYELYLSLSAQLGSMRGFQEQISVECPYILSSMQAKVEAETPEFCEQPIEALQAELADAKEAARIIRRDTYRGNDYDAELSFSAEHQPISLLGILLQLFIEGPFLRETFHYIYGGLSLDEQNSLLRQVWNLSPNRDLTLVDEEDQLDWVREHRLSTPEEIRILGQAVQQFIINKYNSLPEDEKNTVDGIVYELAGSPETADPQWGGNHALDSLSRLARALALHVLIGQD